MPLYRVVDSPTYFKNVMRQPGETVEYSGWPGSTLEPADDVARRIKEFYAENRRSPRLPPKPDLAQFAEADKEPEPKKVGRPFVKKTAEPVEDQSNA